MTAEMREKKGNQREMKKHAKIVEEPAEVKHRVQFREGAHSTFGVRTPLGGKL
jgi:hypothetical protein